MALSSRAAVEIGAELCKKRPHLTWNQIARRMKAVERAWKKTEKQQAKEVGRE